MLPQQTGNDSVYFQSIFSQRITADGYYWVTNEANPKTMRGCPKQCLFDVLTFSVSCTPSKQVRLILPMFIKANTIVLLVTYNVCITVLILKYNKANAHHTIYNSTQARRTQCNLSEDLLKAVIRGKLVLRLRKHR